LTFLLFSFFDFPGPAALPDYLHVEAFNKSCFGHSVQLRTLLKQQHYWG